MDSEHAIAAIGETADTSPRKGLAGLPFRGAVSAVLLAVVLWKLDLTALLRSVSHLSLPWVLATFAAIYVAIAVSALKWGAILSRRGGATRSPTLLRLYMVGQFFNNVLPTTIGGDVVRAWEHARESGNVPRSAGSVLSERLIAGVAQGVATVAALAFLSATPTLTVFAIGFLALDVGFIALFALPRVAEGLVHSVLGGRAKRAAEVTAATVVEVRATLLDPWIWLWVGGLSLVFQACVALVVVCIFGAMGQPLGLAESLVLTPMVFTVTPLPISIGGLGVREAAFAYFYGLVGVPAPAAVAASLLFFAFVAAASLPGAPLFLVMRRRRS